MRRWLGTLAVVIACGGDDAPAPPLQWAALLLGTTGVLYAAAHKLSGGRVMAMG